MFTDFKIEEQIENHGREAIESITSTVQAIQGTFESIKNRENELTVHLTKLSEQLLAYKMLEKKFIINSEEAISNYSCAKDTIESFDKTIDQFVARISKLKAYILDKHLAGSWPSHEKDFIATSVQEIVKNAKSLENHLVDLSSCVYYNDLGVED